MPRGEERHCRSRHVSSSPSSSSRGSSEEKHGERRMPRPAPAPSAVAGADRLCRAKVLLGMATSSAASEAIL